MRVSDDGLLAEQRAYYRARAPEYDEWWQRRGRYDRGSDLAEEWDRQVAQVEAALETFGPTGSVRSAPCSGRSSLPRSWDDWSKRRFPVPPDPGSVAVRPGP